LDIINKIAVTNIILMEYFSIKYLSIFVKFEEVFSPSQTIQIQ